MISKKKKYLTLNENYRDKFNLKEFLSKLEEVRRQNWKIIISLFKNIKKFIFNQNKF